MILKSFLFGTILAASAVAQQSPIISSNPAMDNAIKQLAHRGATFEASSLTLPKDKVVLSGVPGPCSVRLVEMTVSTDIQYTMKTVKPETPTAPMPNAQVPAPPCPKK